MGAIRQGVSRRKLLAGAAAAAIVATGGGRMRRARAAAAPIRLGGFFTLSGSQAVTGKGLMIGSQIAVDQINKAGGVNGRPLELVIRDDKADPNQTVTYTRELMGEGIKLFVAPFLTPLVLAMAGVVPEVDGVCLSLGSLADSLTHEKYDRHIFRCGSNSYTMFRAGARIVTERYPEILQWGALIPQTESARSQWTAFASGLKDFYPKKTGKPAEISEPVTGKWGSTDLNPQIAALMSMPIEGLFISYTGGAMQSMLQHAHSFGLDRKIKVMVDNGNEVELGKGLHKLTPANFWSPTHWYYDAPNKNAISADLYKEYVARTGDPYPNGNIGMGHSAVFCFAEALRKVGKEDDGNAIISALEGMELETAKGKVSFRREDHEMLCNVEYIKLGPDDTERGWRVYDYIAIPGAEIVEAPNPGKPIAY